MANTIKLGNGNWATKEGSLLAYNDERNNFKPLPFTTTRDTIATVVNKQGLIETVGSGIPRIDFSDDAKGALLLEPSRTNLVTTSETLSGYWVASGATIENTNIISPDGTANVKSVKTSATGAYQGILKSESSAFSDKTLTVSTFAKKSNNDYIFFYNIGGVQGSQGVWFNINNGTIGTNLSGWTNTKIEDYGNGWYRCSSTLTYAVSGTDYIYIQNANSDDTINSDINQETYIWGTQLEQGSYATSYIKTVGTAQTRVSDTANGAGSSTVINSTEGVLYAEISTLTELGIFRQINISKNFSNRIYVSKRADNGKLEFRMENPLGALNFSFVQDTTTEFVKVAFRYGVNNFAVFINGVNKNVTPTGNIFTAGTLNKLSLDNGSNTQPFYGKTKSVQVYNTALSDSELAILTTI